MLNTVLIIQVNYVNEEHVFSPEQCLAMLLTKLKDTSVTALQTPVSDCVISVPSYYTNNERKALLDSAAIAGKFYCSICSSLYSAHLYPRFECAPSVQ